ncbi:MAG: cytochrome c [gamma proteobacterium endosymbiont of Lamellibrachia anaximandri]|nr:cytochrome c [gamma proteobacterium endosymbiont of Lamellibrachia anaximandri]MBL3618397.1 cytochrome c [gamma proteobacterium endosymbiont of Lamellibrachia anaximandri]
MKLQFYLVLILPLVLVACEGMDPEERRKAMHLPPVGFKGNPQQGRVLFNQYCVTCHGLSGRGTQQGPPLVQQIYRPAHHADLTFHFAVRDGVRSHHWNFGDMKPLPDVTPETTEHIIAFIRREQHKAGIK